MEHPIRQTVLSNNIHFCGTLTKFMLTKRIARLLKFRRIIVSFFLDLEECNLGKTLSASQCGSPVDPTLIVDNQRKCF